MNRTTYLWCAASIVLAGSFVGLPASSPVRAADQTGVVRNGDDKGPPVLPNGITAKDLDASSGLYRSLAEVTEDALSRDYFTSIAGWLASQDKDRISAAKINLDDLNAQIDKFNAAFKTKYGKALKVDTSKAYDGYVLIATGVVSDPDQLIDKWPVDAITKPRAANPDGKASQADIDAAKNKAFGGRVKLEKDRKVALVRLPGSNDVATVTVSLIHEAPSSWRFDIPNSITAQDLHDNLLKTVTALAAQADWPADIDAAERLVTQHIIASLYGVDSTASAPRTTAMQR